MSKQTVYQCDSCINKFLDDDNNSADDYSFRMFEEVDSGQHVCSECLEDKPENGELKEVYF